MSVFKFAAIAFAVLALIRVLTFAQPFLDQSINQQIFENSKRDRPADQTPEFRVVSASLLQEIEVENEFSEDADPSILESDQASTPRGDSAMWTIDPSRTTTIMIHSDWQAIRVLCPDQSEAVLSNTYPNAGIFFCKANAEQ